MKRLRVIVLPACLMTVCLCAGINTYVRSGFHQTPAPMPQTLIFNPADYGIVEDGKTDDTAAWKALAASLPDNAFVPLLPTMKSVISDTITFSGSGIIIGCPAGRPDARPRGQRGAEFLWAGMTAGKDVIFLDGCHNCQINGLSISCDGGAAPGCALRIDGAVVLASGKMPAYVSTRNTVRNVVVTPPVPVAGTPANFIAYRVGPGKTNNDFMELINCNAMPVKSSIDWGTGLELNAGPNGYTEVVDRCTFTGATIGINQADGSAWVKSCNGTGNGIDIQVGQCSAGSLYEFNNFEATRRNGAVIGGSINVVELSRNRWSGFLGTVLFDVTAKDTWFIRNTFRGNTTDQTKWPMTFAPKSSTGGFSMTLLGNWYEEVIPNRPLGFAITSDRSDNNRGF